MPLELLLMPEHLAKVPADEKEAVEDCFSQLDLLHGYVQDFQHALQIGNFASRNPQFCAWWGVACRDAVMTTFHSGQLIMHGFNMKHCRRFATNANHDILRNIRKNFKVKFPDWEQARHAISHSAERRMTKKTRSLNFVKNLDLLGIVKTENGGTVSFENVVVRDDHGNSALVNSYKPAHGPSKMVAAKFDDEAVLELQRSHSDLTRVLVDALLAIK